LSVITPVTITHEASSMAMCTYSRPRPPAVALPHPVAREAVANPFKTPRLLDVEVNRSASFPAFLANSRRRRGQVTQPRQAGKAQQPANGGGRKPGLFGNVTPAEALAAMRNDELRCQRLSGLGRDYMPP
jgi:hypothetical protein